MGMVINVSGPSLDMALYGDNSNVITSYLSEQMSNFTGAISGISSAIYDRLQQALNFNTDSMIKAAVRNELSGSGVYIETDYIRELETLEALKQANLAMQRWIMAHPKVDELYKDQNVDGYSNTYVNYFGDDNYNYRRVMDGVIQDKPDGSWEVNHYYDELIEGDRDLTLIEKANILNTWSYMDYMLNNSDIDFTNASKKNTKINK